MQYETSITELEIHAEKRCQISDGRPDRACCLIRSRLCGKQRVCPRFEDVMSIVPRMMRRCDNAKKGKRIFRGFLTSPSFPTAGDKPSGTGPYVFEGRKGVSREIGIGRRRRVRLDRSDRDEIAGTNALISDRQVEYRRIRQDRPGTVVYRGNSERARVGTTTMQYIGFNTDRFTGETAFAPLCRWSIAKRSPIIF